MCRGPPSRLTRPCSMRAAGQGGTFAIALCSRLSYSKWKPRSGVGSLATATPAVRSTLTARCSCGCRKKVTEACAAAQTACGDCDGMASKNTTCLNWPMLSPASTASVASRLPNLLRAMESIAFAFCTLRAA